MPDPITGLVVGGTSIGSSLLGAKSAKDAANTQAGAAREGIAAENARFEQMQALLKPYVEAGQPALTQQQNFLGLNGNQAQQDAINGVQNSAQFQSMLQQGNNSILQNASATGGLRGGNTQGALAQFSPQLLNQLIEQQYGKLGGMVQLGQNSAAGVGAAGLQNAGAVSGLLQQQGAAIAGGQLGQAKAYGNLLNMPAQFAGFAMGNPTGMTALKNVFR
jgi:hypothetical protein